MFHDQQLELVRRQAELVARSRALRTSFAQDALVLQRPFGIVDRVLDGFHWLVTHPQWVVAAIVVPLLLRPKKLVGWAFKTWAYWRFWRRAKRLLHLF
jgi:hypothetical protein